MKTKLLLIISIITFFSNYAQTTYVPDDNFEQALIDLGYDTGALDNYVPTANINTITYLNVSYKSIVDLTGIEDFVALTTLYCPFNNLTNLEVSTNTALTTLRCNSNSLTSLIISNNTALTNLRCSSNNLTSLDVTTNTALTTLDCYSNNLTNLEVSTNTVLNELYCFSNSIVSLDLSTNTALTILWCYSNNLTSLNVKNGNNTAISSTDFKATNNPSLTCIEVDDAAWSTTNWTNIDPTASFSENCTASVNQYGLENTFSMYPNPSNGLFKIDSNLSISKIYVFDHLGRKILKFNPQESYNISHLSKGIYFILIESNNKLYKQKIVLN